MILDYSKIQAGIFLVYDYNSPSNTKFLKGHMNETTPKVKSADAEKYRGMAILAYIIFFIPLLTEAKDSPYVKFHVKQGLMVLLSSIAVSVIGSIIPFLGWFLILPIGSLIVLVIWVMGIINALNGEEKQVPLVGKYADQLFKF